MKTIKLFTALFCALLLSPMAKAATETYDFVQAAEGSILLPTWGEEVTSDGVALNMLATADNTFGNRFAVGPTSRNNDSGNCFKFRTAGDWKGLWSQYADRNISILNLKAGDLVTIVVSKEAETLKFVDGETVVSGQTYTVEADGNLDLVSTGSVYIERIVIETVESEGGGDNPGEPETSSEGYDTFSFVQAAEGSILLPTWGEEVTSGGVALNMLATADNTFGNRFAVGPTTRNNDSGNCFKFRTAGDWKGLWSEYGDRNISILNLKKGDQVKFVISKEAETLKFVGGDVVVSGHTYTVETDGNFDLVTTGSVYIESVTIEKPLAAVSISDVEYATFGNTTEFNLAVPEGVTAYAAVASGTTVTLHEIGVIPASAGVIVGGEEGTYIFEMSPVASSYTGENHMVAVTEDKEIPVTEVGKTNYIVTKKDNGLGFYKSSGSGTITKGKAYLSAPTTSGAKMLTIGFNDATGIESISELGDKNSESEVYDLQGRKVKNPTKGLYIVNGKKVIIND